MANIVLCNGRGQLGSALKNLDLWFPWNGKCDRTVYVYHTWNFLNKEQDVQQVCYDTFVKFVNEHKNDEIVFISTYSEQNNWYTYYKQLAESYLLLHVPLSKIIKLPIIIGTGICIDLKTSTKLPYGSLELISSTDAAKETVTIARTPNTENRVFRIRGEIISAKLATHLLTFK